MSHKNILLIQDDPADAKAVREALSRWILPSRMGETLLRGSGATGPEGKQKEQRTDAIAAVLVDLFLPDSQGIETFDRLFRVAPQIPILVLSAVAG